MIIVRLKGGLGNQLFQYACGRHLSQCWHVPLKLDPSSYSEGSGRFYALTPYALAATPLNLADARRLIEPGPLLRRINCLTGKCTPRLRREVQFNFDSQLGEEAPPLVLDGYWQSERYFLASRPLLQAEFSLTLTGVNADLACDMAARNAVAVHVRRGDYLTNTAASVMHGTCPPAYYRRAAEIVEREVGSAHYYLFGDDPAWARQALSFLQPSTIVDCNDSGNAHFDLELMRRCRYHITANSTLSWWGAWLADAVGKIIVSPKQWFLDPSIDTSDLIPVSWHRI